MIITNKNGTYELIDELPNDVKFKKISTPWNYSLVFSLLPKMKVLSILARNY